MQVHCLSLLFVFLLFCHYATSLNIPTNLECGTASDVKAVTSFPYTILDTRDRNAVVHSALTWSRAAPSNNLTIVVDGEALGYSYENYTSFDEVNATNTAVVYNSFDPHNMTFEASATQLPECAGFYLRTNLSNGANLEYTWYVQYEEKDLEFAGRTYKLNATNWTLYIYISGYSFGSNNSAPNSKFTFHTSAPFAPLGVWESVLGQPPYVGPNDAATISAQLIPSIERTTKNGYIMPKATLNDIIPYYTEKNGVQSSAPTSVRGRANQLDNNLQIMSVDTSDTYGGFPFTINDTVRSLKLITYEAVVEQVDGDGDSSSASTLVFPSVMTILLSIIV